MTTARVTVTDGKIFDPLKIRLTQEGGDIDTIVFEISPFTFWDINLSQYDCYVTALGGNNNIDEKKLSYTIDGQKMTIVWSLDDYTLEIGNALIYQLVFKAQDSSAKIWQSYKGLIYVNSEIEESEDEPGPEDYPTILRQFELGLEELERQAFYAYYWMPLGAWIPFQNREKRRLYLNRLTDYDNSCIIEDDNGNIISPSAQTISFDPGNSGLPENLQEAISNIAARAKHCPRFCVNFGNTAAGDADLLSSFSGTLSFKVGDSFPSLTATLANGETIDLAHIDSLNCGDLPNNDYNIFVFKDGTARALHNVIYRQVTPPASPLNGDIWFCAPTNSAKQWNTSGYSITQVTSSITESIIDATMNSTMILAITGNKAYKSTDNGVTWSQSISSTFDMCCCAYFNEKFFIGCSSGKVLYTADSGITWDEVDVDDTSCKVCGMCYYGTNYFAFLSDGSVLSSTDLSSWTKVATIGTSNEIFDVEYHDGTFLACGIRGKIYKSIDGTTWAEKLSNTTCTFTRARWLTGTTWALCSTSFPSTIAISTNDGDSWSLFSIPGSATLDIGYVNSSFIVTAFDGILHGTDFSNMRMIPGNNRHYNVVLGTLLLGICGKVATFADSSCWYDFSGIPIGKITIDNGEISSLENFPINNNGYDINSGVVATTTTHGLIKVASADDEKDETNAQSSITPSNIFRILDYRRTNTEYSVGDIVGCPYHNKFSLLCTTAGTSSSLPLDTSGEFSIGDTITDGTVIWTISYSGGPLGNNPITTLGDLVVGGSSGVPTRLGIGTNGQYLKVGSGGVPEWAAVDVGGGMNNPMSAAGDIIVGGSSGVPARLGIGTNGQYLKVGSGGVPEWAAVDVGGGMNNPMSAAGDIIVGGSSGVPTRLGIGTNGQVLSVNDASAGTLSWTTAATIAEQSLTNNGYVKFSNGLIVQWGYLAFAGTNRKESTITFPTTFSNKNYYAFSGTIKSNVSGTDKHSLCLSENARTASTITVVLYGADSSTTFNGMTWIAVGH